MAFLRFQPKTPIQPEEITGNPELAQAQAVSTFAQDVMQQMKKEAIFTAEKAGAQAGATEDKLPKAIGGQAAQAYNKAALQANRFKLHSDIAEGINSINREVRTANLDPQDALKEFGAKYTSFAQTYLSHVPKENQAYARNALVEHSERSLVAFQGAADKNRRLQAYVAGHDNIQSLKDSMSTSAEQGHTLNSEHYLVEANRSIDFQLKSGNITSPKDAIRLKKDLHDTYIESNVVGQFKSSLTYDEQNGTNTANEFKRNFVDGKTGYAKKIPYDTRLKIAGRLKKFENERSLATGINSGEYSARSKEMIGQARLTGKAPTSADISFLESRPEKSQSILQQTNDAQAVYHISHAPQTLSQIDNTLQNLNVTKGKSTRTEQIRTQALSDVKERRDNFIKDPAGIAIQTPHYQEMLQNAVAREKGEQHLFGQEDKELPNFAKINSDVLLKIEQSQGQPESNLQVQTLGQNFADIDNIKSMPVDHALKFLEAREQEYGANFGMYLRGISGKNGIPYIYPMMMQMSENPAQRPFVRDVRAANSISEADLNQNLKAQGLEPDAVSNATKGQLALNSDFQGFLNTIDTGTASDQTLKTNVIKQTRMLSKYYMSQGMDSKEAVKAAYERAYKMRYSFIGDKYRVIQGEDPNHVRTMMNYIKDNPDNFGMSLTAAPAKDVFPGLLVHTAFQTGKFINDPSDEENFMFVDKFGRPRMTPQGYTLFGKHVNRHYLYFTPLDMQTPEFLSFAQDKEESHFKKIAKFVGESAIERADFIKKAFEIPIKLLKIPFELPRT